MHGKSALVKIMVLTNIISAIALVLLLAAPDTRYYRLISYAGLLGKSFQYTNVAGCDKTVSVTAAHMAERIHEISPASKLIVSDTEADIAIFGPLGDSPPAPLASKMPDPLDRVYVVTYVWMIHEYVVLEYSIAGFDPHHILLQGLGFFGMSGSGTYNSAGDYIGPFVAIMGTPGFNDGPTMQAGIGGVARTDALLKLFQEHVCKK